MMLAIAVGLAAGLGATGRYLLDQLIQGWHDSVFPWGTFAINITGSLLLGLVTGLALHHGLAHRPTVVLSAGFTGGYTCLLYTSDAADDLLCVDLGGRRIIKKKKKKKYKT